LHRHFLLYFLATLQNKGKDSFVTKFYSLFVLQVDPPMPTVSYALMGAPGVTMSVPPGAQYNELSEWKKSYHNPQSCSGLEDRIPSRSHSAAAIHFDDHKDKELIKRRYNRRHSLSPNFIVNENNRYNNKQEVVL